MRNSNLIICSVVAIGSIVDVGGASAADMAPAPVYASAAAPVFNWTGCYAGLHAGAGLMHDIYSSNDSGGGPIQNGSGALGGGQVGCNYQTGLFVVGLEGEAYWSGIKSTYGETPSVSSPFDYTTHNKYDFSIAARMGFAYDRAYFYGKAGWVWGKFQMHENFLNCCDNNGNNFTELTDGSTMLNGLLLGVGMEYALTEHWTVKGEYNYLNYGSKMVTYTNNNLGTISFFGGSQGADKQTFKIGANYLFNAGPMLPRP
jgi:outer membrane immunogenic protein